MEKRAYDACLKVLEAELLKSLGCTEPAAVAFTAAKATTLLGKMPESMEVNSSGNIIKNVKGVIVPNSGGLRGIAPAAILGMLVNKPEMELAILDGVTPEDTAKAKELLETDFCKSTLEEGEGNLYVDVTVRAGDESARAVIRKSHTNIELLEKNGEVLQQGKAGDDDADISELKKMRTANPAHIWGEATQSVFLRKRMPQKGELKYYAKQVVDVRPFCVCEHAAFNDGGTKARHSKRREKRSLGPDSPSYDCLTSELCPAWKQWSEATKKVELTEAQNEKIDAVSDELEELEKRFKELLDERERERKEKQKERGK